MKIKTTLPVSEARKKIFSIIKDIQKPETYYTLTDRGIPRAVIVSAEHFESFATKSEHFFKKEIKLFQSICAGENMILNDGIGHTYGFNPPSGYFVLRDLSNVGYSRYNTNNARKEKELTKAQLLVYLVQKYKYNLSLMETGVYVNIGKEESRKYMEIDLVLFGPNKRIDAIFLVSAFGDYEINMEKTTVELFEAAHSLERFGKNPRWLIYYSKTREGKNEKEKVLAIDYEKYKTFESWKSAGKPYEKKIPSLNEN